MILVNMNSLQEVYLRCVHALSNVDGFFDYKSDTQYGLMNYIAKFSLASDQYLISKNARTQLPEKSVYTRGADFPRNSKSGPEFSFTFEHPIPASHIRNCIKHSDKTYESIMEILRQSDYIVVLTQAENSSIPVKYKSKMPDGWKFGDDPFVRYSEAGIILDGSIRVRGAIKR